MNLSNKAIKEIAENLDCGMICYVHKETKEIKSILNPDNILGDKEFWQKELDDIEKNWNKYLKIDMMSSSESFQMMEDFLGQVRDESIKKRLVFALNKNKPFKNFKHEIDYNNEVRQQWFTYKSFRYEEWVKSYIENEKD